MRLKKFVERLQAHAWTTLWCVLRLHPIVRERRIFEPYMPLSFDVQITAIMVGGAPHYVLGERRACACHYHEEQMFHGQLPIVYMEHAVDCLECRGDKPCDVGEAIIRLCPES